MQELSLFTYDVEHSAGVALTSIFSLKTGSLKLREHESRQAHARSQSHSVSLVPWCQPLLLLPSLPSLLSSPFSSLFSVHSVELALSFVKRAEALRAAVCAAIQAKLCCYTVSSSSPLLPPRLFRIKEAYGLTDKEHAFYQVRCVRACV